MKLINLHFEFGKSRKDVEEKANFEMISIQIDDKTSNKLKKLLNNAKN